MRHTYSLCHATPTAPSTDSSQARPHIGDDGRLQYRLGKCALHALYTQTHRLRQPDPAPTAECRPPRPPAHCPHPLEKHPGRSLRYHACLYCICPHRSPHATKANSDTPPREASTLLTTAGHCCCAHGLACADQSANAFSAPLTSFRATKSSTACPASSFSLKLRALLSGAAKVQGTDLCQSTSWTSPVSQTTHSHLAACVRQPLQRAHRRTVLYMLTHQTQFLNQAKYVPQPIRVSRPSSLAAANAII